MSDFILVVHLKSYQTLYHSVGIFIVNQRHKLISFSSKLSDLGSHQSKHFTKSKSSKGLVLVIWKKSCIVLNSLLFQHPATIACLKNCSCEICVISNQPSSWIAALVWLIQTGNIASISAHSFISAEPLLFFTTTGTEENNRSCHNVHKTQLARDVPLVDHINASQTIIQRQPCSQLKNCCVFEIKVNWRINEACCDSSHSRLQDDWSEDGENTFCMQH